jgi:hypothetical protein
MVRYKWADLGRGLVVAALVSSAAATVQAAEGKLEKPAPISSAPWAVPAPESLRQELESVLKRGADERQQQALLVEAEPMLSELSTADDPLETVVNLLSVTSPRIARFVATARSSPLDTLGAEWLNSEDVNEFMRSNLRLFAARALVREGYFDEGLTLLDQIKFEELADPASYLFFRAIVEHQLVRLDASRITLHRLLSHGQPLPARYETLARLMQTDVAGVEPDSLGHIARRMSDAERRLELKKADEQSQLVQREIVEALDRLIEKKEEQQRKQQQQQGQAQGTPSSTPMEESRITDLKGEGKVDIRDIGNQAGWGDLPPKERERVLQEIGRDFPAHYRDLIEEYLRRLATDERTEENP